MVSHPSVGPDPRRDFRLFWVSGAVSRLGTHASGIALPLLVLAIGGSPLLAGAVGTTEVGVGVLVSPVAGVWADRYSRRGLMCGAALLAAIGMTAIAVLVLLHLHWWLALFAAVALSGAATGIFAAAAAGSIRAILPPDDPEGALGLLQAREQGALVAGPGLGGLLYQWVAWLPFLFDSITYLFAAGCIRSMRSALTPEAPDAPGRSSSSLRRELAGGFRFVRANPFLRFVVVWAGGVNLVVGALYLEAVLVLRLQGTSARAVGVLLTIVGCAGVLGALAASRVIRALSAGKVVTIASWTMAAAALVPLLTSGIWGIGLMLAVVTMLTPAVSIVLQTKAIMSTPDGLQARVGATLGATAEGTGAVAPLLAGVLVDHLGVSAMAWLFGGALASLAAYASLNKRHLSSPASVVKASNADPTVADQSIAAADR